MDVVVVASNQRTTAERFGADYSPVEATDLVGAAVAKLTRLPLNALRHPPEVGTSGWYIWGGEEFPDDPEFFQPLHAVHLKEYCPSILSYLGLGPGWRVLLAPDYEDVWFDGSLLAV